MAKNFLLYWRPETVESHLSENYLLNHAGSNQLARAQTGDILWIVTTGEADELGLAGRLKVGALVSLEEACRRLGRNDLWTSRRHALAAPGIAQRMCGLSLMEIAHELRFVHDGAAQLFVSKFGGVSAEQLRRMRELDASSSRFGSDFDRSGKQKAALRHISRFLRYQIKSAASFANSSTALSKWAKRASSV